jgi:hypothetical protein
MENIRASPDYIARPCLKKAKHVEYLGRQSLGCKDM